MPGAEEPLDPYQCLSKPRRDYASECREVYLTGQGAETLSERFSHFENLEVLWLTGNRLSHLNCLESNRCVREVYVQDNRLVSLQGLRAFTFLTTLLASNNQLRNLDKQLAALFKLKFLRKLDLFDNPAAEEPDYRLRAIYALPLVDVLDKRSVKGLERTRAEEVVPNIDKVTAGRAEAPRKQAPKDSAMERAALREAKKIQKRRSEDQEKQVLMFTSGSTIDEKAPPPRARAVEEQRKLWESRRAQQFALDTTRPSLWEQAMRPLIAKRAGKSMLTKAEVVALARDLADDGLEEIGHMLGDAGPLGLTSGPGGDQTLRPAAAAPMASLDQLFESHAGETAGAEEGREATVPVSEVANWLLKLDWPQCDDDNLDRRVALLHDQSQAATGGKSGADTRDVNPKRTVDFSSWWAKHIKAAWQAAKDEELADDKAGKKYKTKSGKLDFNARWANHIKQLDEDPKAAKDEECTDDHDARRRLMTALQLEGTKTMKK